MICKQSAGDEDFVFRSETRVNVAFKKSLRGGYCLRKKLLGRVASRVQLLSFRSNTPESSDSVLDPECGKARRVAGPCVRVRSSSQCGKPDVCKTTG
jgi:hypothetical protein